jgi:nucleoside-diphosphate kinase
LVPAIQGFKNVNNDLDCRPVMQTTFIIYKPDCMEMRLVGTVLSRFEKEGFEVVGCKMGRLTPEMLRVHYAHMVDKPFYPSIEQFMSSRPVIFMALRGENVIQRVRDLLGPTNPKDAPKGTIRGDFGTGIMANLVHASDSAATAKTELARFFKPEELFQA